MANITMDPLEQIWEDLLSRQPELVRNRFFSLNTSEQASAIQHLERMAHEPGWLSAQRLSAKLALNAIHQVKE